MERCRVIQERDIDGNVIEACQQGDMSAFQMLFEAYKDKVYSIAFYFSRDEASARDITQQVFLKLFTSIGQFRRDCEFTTWLYRLVANACTDEHRRRRRFVSFDDEAGVMNMIERGSQEENYIRRQINDSVRAAIADLKPKLRLPILLKYVEGLSYDEIANVLGCSKGTVASRLNRGHKLLARKLAPYRGALDSG